MATGTAATTARQYHEQMVHYARFAVNFNDAGIDTGVSKQTLPVGAVVLRSNVRVTAAFNAATTNVLTAGLNGTTANDLVASGDVNEASAQMFGNIAPTAAAPLAADTPIYVKFTQTGTAATTGAAIFVVEYVVNNDR